MRIYLDTNVYHLIAEHDEALAARQFLDQGAHSVVASNLNLLEAWAGLELKARTDRVRAITTVARTYDEQPQSFRHARELLKEIRRCRPRWVRRFLDKRGLSFNRAALRAHRARWREAKECPGVRPDGFLAYRSDAKTADLSGQRQFRQALLQLRDDTGRIDLVMWSADPELAALTALCPPAELYVRHVGAFVWEHATRHRHPAMRDYYDWLSPYVITDSFAGRDYWRFWLGDVDLSKMPLNTITGLAEFYQAHYKITQGNFLDCLHANYLAHADIVATADLVLHGVLGRICETVELNATPVLIEWAKGSAVMQLANGIGQVSRRQQYGSDEG